MNLMFETILELFSGSWTQDWLMVRALQGGSIRGCRAGDGRLAVHVTVLL